MELSRIKIFLVALSLGIFNNSSASRITDENVHDMVFEWSLRSPQNISHSFISIWNVSMVTDLSELFAFNDNFNQELNIWDTSRVTDFHSSFAYAYAFNRDLSSWNVGLVTNMR